MIRPYDGITYNHSSEDADQTAGFEALERLLGFRPSVDGLRYSLSLYSGGVGVFDRIAVRCRYPQDEREAIARRLHLKAPVDAPRSPEWLDDLKWLVAGDEPQGDLDLECRAFINSQRRDFQDPALASTPVFFSDGSDVNSWCAVWLASGFMNYLSFDQG